MANIFKQTNDQNNDVNRNTFDLSFQNNLTLKFGNLYPVFLKEGLPGSSFKIRPSFGLNFMPMVFPVQTRIRAYLHFFKVRKRSLWSGFMDYVSKNKASLKDSMPYLDLSSVDVFNNVAKTGSLGDYLGIPTTIVGNYANLETTESDSTCISYNTTELKAPAAGATNPLYGNSNLPRLYNILCPTYDEMYNGDADRPLFNTAYLGFGFDFTKYRGVTDRSAFEDLEIFIPAIHANIIRAEQYVFFSSSREGTDNQYVCKDLCFNIFNSHEVDSRDNSCPFTWITNESHDLIIRFNKNLTTEAFNAFTAALLAVNESSLDLKINVCFKYSANNQIASSELLYTDSIVNGNDGSVITEIGDKSVILQDLSTPPNVLDVTVTYQIALTSKPTMKMSYKDTSLSLRDLSHGDTPYYDSVSNPDGIKLNALPFRAYESIYNAFYRNILNDPFILDGTPEYNKFIPTDKGGADTTPYTFHARYWEDDFLTTAIQNPQASDFPVVVGITNLNGQGVGLSVRDEEGNNYQLKATISEDGKSITKFDVTDLPQSEIISNPKAFIDLAQSGISITDFRCANALQRWLEMNARKGLRFKDIIKGRFDVDIRFDELNMPEFIGGDTAEVNIGQINQSVGSRDGNFDDVLGSYAGQASCMKRSDNAITTFCDEPCYIIGLLSVVPVANYSQLLPKLFTKRDILDEFSPEFAHIGYQPIPYSEVCPTQAFKDKNIKLTDPFGYQRAWYDYIASTDEVHGQFRTSLRNFLVNRVFGSRPILSHSFLTVNNDDINDIFSVTADTDKILGQVYFDCQVKHPIPKFGIPKLEA